MIFISDINKWFISNVLQLRFIVLLWFHFGMSGTKTTDIWGLRSMMKPNNHPIFVEMNWNLNALFVVIVCHLLGVLKKKKRKALVFSWKLSFFPWISNNFAVKDVGLWCLYFSHQCISLIWNMLQRYDSWILVKPSWWKLLLFHSPIYETISKFSELVSRLQSHNHTVFQKNERSSSDLAIQTKDHWNWRQTVKRMVGNCLKSHGVSVSFYWMTKHPKT